MRKSMIPLAERETDPVSGHHILTCTLAPCDSTFKLNAVLAAVVRQLRRGPTRDFERAAPRRDQATARRRKWVAGVSRR
jgi:hypothetical protein